MRRIVEPDRIVYLERHRKLSFVMFLMAVGCVGLPLLLDAKPKMKDSSGPVAYAVGFLLAALSLQHRRRAVIIEPARDVLRIVERDFLRAARHRELPLREVSVAVTSAVQTRPFLPDVRRYWIWIEVARHPRILFAGYVGDQPTVQERVLDLRQDLRERAVLGSAPGPDQYP